MAQATENYRRIHLRTSHKIALAVVGALSALAAVLDPRALGVLFGGAGFPAFPYHLDLDVYRVGAQRVLDGLELYSGHFHIVGDINLPFTYPPISALLFTPLTVLPYTASSVLLTLATVTLTWWVLAHTVHLAAWVDRKSAAWVAVGLAAVLIHLSPIHTSITYGQINVLLMAMVFADAFVVPRRFRGLLTGLAVSIKLTPAVFGLWFLLRKEWGSVVRMGLGAIGATGLAWLILPRDSVKYWTETLRETGRIGGEEYALNQSLNGLLYRLGLRTKTSEGGGAADGAAVGDANGAADGGRVGDGSGGGVGDGSGTADGSSVGDASGGGVGDQVGEALRTAEGMHGVHGAQLWLVLIIVALIVVAFVMVRLLRANAPIVALCVNAIFALLASPVSWSHHWCWTPVLLVAIGSYALAERNTRKCAPAASNVPVASDAPAGHDDPAASDAPAGTTSTSRATSSFTRTDHALVGPRWMWIALLITGFLAFALEPTTLVPFNDHRELDWNIWQQFVGNVYLWWTLIALLLLGVFARKHLAESSRSLAAP